MIHFLLFFLLSSDAAAAANFFFFSFFNCVFFNFVLLGSTHLFFFFFFPGLVFFTGAMTVFAAEIVWLSMSTDELGLRKDGFEKTTDDVAADV